MCVLLAAGIFAFDLLTPLGVASGVPYVGLVLIAIYLRKARAAILLAVIGTLLTLLGYALSPGQVASASTVLINRLLAIFAIWAAAVVTYLHLRSLAELLPLTDQDELTDLYNRRYFNAEASRQISAWRRFHNPLSLIMLDIDHFKEINDEHGHIAGDQVLLRLADVLRRQTRDIDTVCRYGGEEFVILLPYTDIQGAIAKAEQIRRAVGMLKVRWQGTIIRFQISLGVAEFRNPSWRVGELVATADQALYQAKKMGRNRTVSAPIGPAHYHHRPRPPKASSRKKAVTNRD